MAAPVLAPPRIISFQQLAIEADPDYWDDLRQPLQYEFSNGREAYHNLPFYTGSTSVIPSAAKPILRAPTIGSFQQQAIEADPDYWDDLRQPLQYEFSNGREFYHNLPFYTGTSGSGPSVVMQQTLQAPRITNFQHIVAEADPDFYSEKNLPLQYEFSNGREFHHSEPTYGEFDFTSDFRTGDFT